MLATWVQFPPSAPPSNGIEGVTVGTNNLWSLGGASLPTKEVTMKLFVVKYLFRGQRYAVRILAETPGKATNTAIEMTRGHIYSVTEVI